MFDSILKNARRIGFVLASILSTACWAQSYPDKPITIIVPVGAGAGTDFMARSLVEGLSAELGKPVVIENRGGSAGFLGTDVAKRAPSDGYTLLVAPDDVPLWRALGIHKSINVLTDFEPVALLGTVDFFLVVSGDALAAKVPADLVQLAKARPGVLSYASPGPGSPQNLAMELFKQKTGTDFIHVPYKGMGPAVPDVLAGRVQAMITGFPTIAAHLDGGKIRVLGAAYGQRSQQLPNVPTLAEQGFPNIEVQGYFSLLAPKGTPPAVINRLNAAVKKVLANPQVRDALQKRAMTPVGSTPEELRTKLRSEIDKWTAVVQAAGIKAE